MSASEFLIMAAVVIVGLIFLIAAQNFIFGEEKETREYGYKAEGESLASLLNRIATEPAHFVSYSQELSLSNISIKGGVLTYERNGAKFSFPVSKEINDAYLEDTSSICIMKSKGGIDVGSKCVCNYDGSCAPDECKEICDDCYGPEKICIGDGFCNKNIGENCLNSKDCSCDLNKVCCPEDPDANENGCSDKKDLEKGNECWCTTQCTKGLNCNPTINEFKDFKNACCGAEKSWNGNECVDEKPKLKIIFVPVNWDGSMDTFDSTAKTQFDEIIKNIPLSECPKKAKMITIHTNCRPGIESGMGGNDCPSLSGIKRCIDASGEEYDYGIGLEDNDVCGRILGYSGGIGVVFSESSVTEVSVHELGHEWGLNDEYVDACRCGYGLVSSSANCLKSELSGNDPAGGYSSAYCGGGQCAGYTVTCMGNKNPFGGRCIMSYGGAPGPRAFCQECNRHLSTVPIINC